MSRYIDADKIPYYLRYVSDCQDSDIYKIALAREIAEIPTADVVEVVRCKDCKYSVIDDNGNLWCAFYNGKIREMPNGYCWHGERKEE